MKKPVRLMLSLLITSVLLSACGGGDGGTTESSSSTTTSTTPSIIGGITLTDANGNVINTGTTGTGTGTTDGTSITVNTPGEFILPFDKEKTWTVCQGYNTSGITHKGDLAYSLDLSLDASAAEGSSGCSLVTANTSTGQNVYAPADGKLLWYGLDPIPGVGVDVACFTLDKTASNGANSIMVGHLDTRSFVATGTSVKQGTLIGTVNSPSAVNGMYAHIHISTYTSKICTGGNIPLNNVFGSAYNFTSDGSAQQWRGTKVTRR